MRSDDAEHVSTETSVHQLTRKLVRRLKSGRTIRMVADAPNGMGKMLTVSARVQERVARDRIKLFWRIIFSGPQDSSITMESFVGGGAPDDLNKDQVL